MLVHRDELVLLGYAYGNRFDVAADLRVRERAGVASEACVCPAEEGGFATGLRIVLISALIRL
jgi:hypothetical protein